MSAKFPKVEMLKMCLEWDGKSKSFIKMGYGFQYCPQNPYDEISYVIDTGGFCVTCHYCSDCSRENRDTIECEDDGQSPALCSKEIKENGQS